MQPFFLAGLLFGILVGTAPTQADEDAIAECQDQLKVCGLKKDYDSEKCKKLAQELPDCDAESEPGTVCRLRLSAITPTQVSVGARAAQCKADELKAKEQEQKFKDGLTRFLLKPLHLVPTVIGPDPDQEGGHRFYITDHHHLSYALYLTATEQGKSLDDYGVYACIIADQQSSDPKRFWDFMVRNHYAWLDDNRGQAIGVETLQRVKSLADLKDYPFRTWSRWVRDSCGYLKLGNDCLGKKPSKRDLKKAGVQTPPPYFMEFKWADYLEQNLEGGGALDKMDDAELQAKLAQALQLAQGGQAYLEDLPGYNDSTQPIFPVRPVSLRNGCETESGDEPGDR
jgi:hypothetical protein